ncbi:MAG: energy transducer TonB [Acidobacteriota bacterium]
MKWFWRKREVCPTCSKSFEGILAKDEKARNETETQCDEAQDYYDLNSLLASIRVKEEEVQVFSDIWAPRGFPHRSVMMSGFLHVVFLSLAYNLSGFSFSEPLPLTLEALEKDYKITYYRASDLLPKISSASDGPKEPAGHKKDVKPPKGSTSFHPSQTVQSAPLKPDNFEQTIVQPSAPKVEIKEKVKVPNIVVWNVEESKVESIQIANKQVNPLFSQKMDAPAARPPDPVEPELKDLSRSVSELTIAKSEVINTNPKLVLRPTANPEWSMGSDSGNPGPLINAPLGGGGDQLRNIVVMSANPGLPGPGGIQVPAGNRTGAFSVSPEGNRAGSPDGVDGGVLGGGVPGGGGSGKGGNGFGSGGNIAGIQIPGLSVKGGNPGSGPTVAGPGRRPRSPGGFSDMVTIDDPGESYNITVVEGRRGGAGLGVYGVLSGKRNYTVFVPMPSGRWIMQFSEMADSGPMPPVAQASMNKAQVYINAGEAIVQPRPLRKVDPGRPEDEELAQLRGMVVLYAVIRKDGSVDKIRVIRSLNPALDGRAMEALKQWKFKAAQLGDEPIEVQALFGIPFRPQSR